MAEIGAGAEGWASGSQEWNGTMAAFRPKPIRNRPLQKPTTYLMFSVFRPGSDGAETHAAGQAEDDGDGTAG